MISTSEMFGQFARREAASSLFSPSRVIRSAGIAGLVATALTVAGAAIAGPGTNVVYSGGAGGQFGQLNVDTGVYTSINNGAVFNAGTGYVDGSNLFVTDASNGLYRLALSNGAFTSIASLTAISNANSTITGLAYKQSTNQLFALAAMTGGAATQATSLYLINNPTLGTATATLIGITGDFGYGTLAFDNGTLYATGNQTSGSKAATEFFTINTSTGAGSLLNASSGLVADTYGLVETPTSVFYAVDSVSKTYFVNPATGTATADATYGGGAGSVNFVAVATIVAPEPGALALAASAALPFIGIVVRRRRHRIA